MTLKIKGEESKYISIIRNDTHSIANILKVEYDFGFPSTNYIVEKWSKNGYDKTLVHDLPEAISFIFDGLDIGLPEFEIIYEWFKSQLTEEMKNIILK